MSYQIRYLNEQTTEQGYFSKATLNVSLVFEFEKTVWTFITHKQAGSHFPFKFAQEGRAEGTTVMGHRLCHHFSQFSLH